MREVNDSHNNVSTGLLQSLYRLSLRYQYVQSITSKSMFSVANEFCY